MFLALSGMTGCCVGTGAGATGWPDDVSGGGSFFVVQAQPPPTNARQSAARRVIRLFIG